MKPYFMSGDRLVIHLKMKPVALVRVRQCNSFIELDAEARFGRQEHPPCLPADRLFEDLRMETFPGFDAFEDQEIRQRGGKMYVGGAFDRSRIEMGCDLSIM